MGSIVDSATFRSDAAANAVVLDVVIDGASARLLIDPPTANQMIRDLQDAMIALGHTTYMAPVRADEEVA